MGVMQVDDCTCMTGLEKGQNPERVDFTHLSGLSDLPLQIKLCQVRSGQ